MSDLPALQDFICRLEEHMSKMRALPEDTEIQQRGIREIFGRGSVPTAPRGCQCPAALPSTGSQPTAHICTESHRNPLANAPNHATATDGARPKGFQHNTQGSSARSRVLLWEGGRQGGTPGLSQHTEPQPLSPGFIITALCSPPAREKSQYGLRGAN